MKDRSKASDFSEEHSQGNTGQGRSGALQRTQSIARSTLATAPSATLATAPSATQAAAPSAAQAIASSAIPAAALTSARQTHCSAAADLLVAAAAAVNRAAALKEAEADTYANSNTQTAVSTANANPATSVDRKLKAKALAHAERRAVTPAQMTEPGQGSRRVKHKVCFMSWPAFQCCKACLCPGRLEVRRGWHEAATGCRNLLESHSSRHTEYSPAQV